MRIEFVGFPHTRTYQDHQGTWQPGDQREVDDSTAQRLLTTFPGAFRQGSSPRAEKPDETMHPAPRTTAAIPAADAAPKRSPRSRSTRSRKS